MPLAFTQENFLVYDSDSLQLKVLSTPFHESGKTQKVRPMKKVGNFCTYSWNLICNLIRRFMYYEEVTLNGDNVMSILYLAKKYFLKHLLKKCNVCTPLTKLIYYLVNNFM